MSDEKRAQARAEIVNDPRHGRALRFDDFEGDPRRDARRARGEDPDKPEGQRDAE